MTGRRTFVGRVLAALGLAVVAGVPKAHAQAGAGRPAPPVPCAYGCGAVASHPGQYLVTADLYANLPTVVWSNMKVYVCTNGHVFVKHRTGQGW